MGTRPADIWRAACTAGRPGWTRRSRLGRRCCWVAGGGRSGRVWSTSPATCRKRRMAQSSASCARSEPPAHDASCSTWRAIGTPGPAGSVASPRSSLSSSVSASRTWRPAVQSSARKAAGRPGPQPRPRPREQVGRAGRQARRMPLRCQKNPDLCGWSAFTRRTFPRRRAAATATAAPAAAGAAPPAAAEAMPVAQAALASAVAPLPTAMAAAAAKPRARPLCRSRLMAR
mmetsp:Transcript_24983/g.71182  ORF Transcript_24983/g.71182 Transcript_24983/m.71182 type:complete len:230 (-) Transcript_24983:97-786(-)